MYASREVIQRTCTLLSLILACPVEKWRRKDTCLCALERGISLAAGEDWVPKEIM